MLPSNKKVSRIIHPYVDVDVNLSADKPRDVDSEIDYKIIDQLHNAVLLFSKNCMQSKKILFSFLGIFVAAMLRVDSLSDVAGWFPVMMGIAGLFWSFDAQSYYYQEKLRENMDQRFASIKRRYQGNNEDEFTLPDYRQKKGRFWRSVFNASTFFYPIIIVCLGVFWLLIENCLIG